MAYVSQTGQRHITASLEVTAASRDCGRQPAIEVVRRGTHHALRDLVPHPHQRALQLIHVLMWLCTCLLLQNRPQTSRVGSGLERKEATLPCG